LKRRKIINVAGARPNFMKIAPLMAAQEQCDTIEPILVHTGQHYDERMSELFFRQLGIPAPEVNLGVGSASHAAQTAAIMKAFEPVVIAHDPAAVLVVGDVNSTIACALVAVKLGVRVIHVEAGLRSFDRTMPEEINRLLTDAISSFLFCTEPSGADNLAREGIGEARGQGVFLVGNVMIDTLVANRPKADASGILDELGLAEGGYAVLTLHRPANVDSAGALGTILDALDVIQRDMPIVFPVHPRTRDNLARMGLSDRLAAMEGLRLIDPAGYVDFLRLISSAGLVLTDSGGIQEETTFLKVPCLTLRDSTERPITVEIGTNRVVGTEAGSILAGYRQATGPKGGEPQIPPLWDGHTAERIVEILREKL